MIPSTAEARPYRREAFRIRVLTLLAVLVALVSTGVTALTLHRREIRDTRQRVSLVGTLLSEEASQAFKNVDLTLDSLVDDVERDGIATPAAFAASRGTKEAHQALEAKRLGLPQVDSIAFVSADGHQVGSSRGYPVQPVDLSDRDYFVALAHRSTKAPYLSVPVRDRGPGHMSMFVARRIEARDGTFLGLAICGIRLDSFLGLYRSLELGRGVSIGLWRRDGTQVVRFPDAPPDAASPAWLSEMGEGRSATYETDAGYDGRPQVESARATSDLSLVVSVSALRSQALEDWRLFSLFLALSAIGSIVAVVLAGEAVRARYLALEQRNTALADRERIVDQRERAEAQLRQSQKMEAVGQLTGGIAHDFNNMLSVVVGSLGVLGRRLERGDPDVGRFVDSAREAANRASGLTRRLLALSRQQDIEPEVIEVDAAISEAAEIAMRTVGRSLTFDFDPGAPTARILVDPSQLENAILNLAINARDAMPGGGAITIATATLSVPGPSGPSEHVEIRVSDTGTGMSEEVLAQARDPFFTTKAAGSGTGLGLSQVAGFCERSGGRLEIESSLGIGTTIRMVLPTTVATAGARVGSDEIPAAEPPGALVLVVDDEESVRATTVAMLRDLGYRVVHAHDAKSALALAGTIPGIGLLVTDVVMPGGDGMSLARDAERLLPGLPTVLVSGFTGTTALADGVRVLAKPYDLGQLARAVAAALAPKGGDAARGIAA
jgi:signal transduction histidine kinase/CheY-like chemotaxis protein